MIKDEKQTIFLKIYLHMNLINYETVKYIYTMKKGTKIFFRILTGLNLEGGTGTTSIKKESVG